MLNKAILGMEQCQAAINAMIAEFNKEPGRRPIAMAIVDDNGNLLSYAQTDGCRASTGRNTIRKAYSASIGGMDSAAYGERLKTIGISVTEMGDPMLFSGQGGVVVVDPKDGTVLGGVGVAGLPTGKADEDIARIGLGAMNL
jgi:uncharacterized protein GlcG (DUF336 family)